MTTFHLPTATPDLPPVYFAPMEVARVGGEMETHIEPALDNSWSPIEKLRWNAGVAKADSGLVIYLRQLPEQDHDAYAVRLSGTYWHSGGFQRTWRTINDLSGGAEARNTELGHTIGSLHAPTTVTIDGADSRNPEGEGNVTICRTCSHWDGDDLIRAVYAPCDTAKALGVRG